LKFFQKKSKFPTFHKKNGKQTFRVPQFIKIENNKIGSLLDHDQYTEYSFSSAHMLPINLLVIKNIKDLSNIVFVDSPVFEYIEYEKNVDEKGVLYLNKKTSNLFF
jgi:hypothetical protein